MNDSIIVVKEGEEGSSYYTVLDGNGRALYCYYTRVIMTWTRKSEPMWASVVEHRGVSVCRSA